MLTALALAGGCGGGASAPEPPDLPGAPGNPPDPPSSQDRLSPSVSAVGGLPAGTAPVSGEVKLNLAAADDTGISTLDVYINGRFVNRRRAAAYDLVWDSRRGPDGWTLIEAFARDSAGNIGSNRALVVVNNQPPALPDLPELDESVVPTIPTPAVEPLNPGLPPQSPESIPRLILTGIPHDWIVSRTLHIDAIAFDDVGVDLLFLEVNGHLVATSTTSAMSITWDTTSYPDGPLVLDFFALDGDYRVHFPTEVLIDNTTDRQAPEIFVEPGIQNHGDQRVPLNLVVQATDQTEVELLKLEVDPGGDAGSYVETAGGSTDETIRYTLTVPPGHSYQRFAITVSARDKQGLRAYKKFEVRLCQYGSMEGRIYATNGRRISGATIESTSPVFTEDTGATSQVASTSSDEVGRFRLGQFEFGKHRLRISKGEYAKEFNLLLDLSNPSLDIPAPITTLPATHKQAHESRRVAVLSRGADNPLAAFSEFRSELEFDLLPPVAAQTALFSSDAELYRYRIIVLSADVEAHSLLNDAAKLARLRGWLADGGKLACFGKSYYALELLYPEAVDFAGGSGDGLAAVAEPPGAALQAPAGPYLPALEPFGAIGPPARWDADDNLYNVVYGFQLPWPLVVATAPEVEVNVVCQTNPGSEPVLSAPAVVTCYPGLGEVHMFACAADSTDSTQRSFVERLLLDWN